MGDHFTSTPLYGTNGHSYPLMFSVNELRAILSAYSTGVMKKGWRDYAIQSLHGQSIFSVVDRGSDDSDGAVLYSISKNKSAKTQGKPYWRVFDRQTQILRTENGIEAVETFAACGDRRKKGR